MSNPSSSLHSYLDARLRETFGQPHHTLGRDDHWQLQFSPAAPHVNLLVNGTGEKPAIWVFDSQNRTDGVFSRSITESDQVNEVIIQIQERVMRAGQPEPSAQTADPSAPKGR